MSVKILYDNTDVFSGIAPTPFISFSQDFIDFNIKQNQVTNISLEGQLTGKFIGQFSYNYLNDSVKKLFSGFNNNYKSLKIIENSTVLFSGNSVIINSINLDESSWYGILPFSIDITYYDSGLFNDYFGVLDPEENISYTEEDGDILSLTHSISAIGIPTESKNAIENAKLWVLERTGNYNKINPILIKDNAYKNYLLISSKETIDRFNGSYSWEGIYNKSINIESPSNAFLNYTIDLNSGYNDGFVTASIQGNLRNNDIASVLRDEYNKLDLYTICNNAAIKTFNTQLSNRVVSRSVNELLNENVLSFQSTFNNDYTPDVINNYSIDLNQDLMTCNTDVNLRAEISAKYGDISGRWQKVKSFYDTGFYPYQYALEEYSKEISGSGTLKANPISESLVFDELNAQISYSASYNDKKTSYDNNIITLSSSVTYTPSVNIHVSNPSALFRRSHNVQNLNCANRSTVQFTVTAIGKINLPISTVERTVRSEINRLINNYVKGGKSIRESSTINKNQNIKSITITETWSFEGDIIS
jgi:hypothetical protein